MKQETENTIAEKKELTLGLLNDSFVSLQQLANKPLKISIAILLTRFLKSVQTEIEIYRDMQKELAEKYGTKAENGYNIKHEYLEEFNEKLNELNKTPINPSIVIPEICINELMGTFQIEPAHLLQLEWLLID